MDDKKVTEGKVDETKPQLVRGNATSNVPPDEDRLLSLDEIIATEDTQFFKMHIPEWKGSIRLGSLSAGQVLEFIELNEGPAKKNAGFRLINDSLVDADGKRIGDEKKLAALRTKDSNVINRIVSEILKLNGMHKKTAEEEKNESGGATPGASPTA